MKFKVGDKVRVREDLVAVKSYGGCIFTREMEEYKGKILTINLICSTGYKLKGVDYWWTDEMLEGVKENKIEKTILEIINDGYTGKKYIHECGTIVYVDCKNTLRFDYRESNRIPGDKPLERWVALDMKLKEYRKEYTFDEAFKAYEEGREIESCVDSCKYKNGEFKASGYSVWRELRAITVGEIRGMWYIND